jgi:hypothetical protein
MISALRLVLGLTLLIVVLSFPSTAWAGGDSMATAIHELANNQDFRVRTQAALTLGTSGEGRAVEPLCRALDDNKAAVRAAAAAALGKLALGGIDCLEKHEATEATDSVKNAIVKALQSIRAKGEGSSVPEGVIDSTTRFYISIGKTADNTQRKKSKVNDVVRVALIKSLLKQKGITVGPDGETKAQYQKRIAGKKGIKGFLLSPKVQSPEYGDDSITVRFEIAILTFPEKALKGMIPVKLTQQGSVKKSDASEDELISMAVERAVEKLMKNIDRIDS